MAGFRDYRVTEACLAQARKLGFDEEVVIRMARQAAPFTHPQGNRRFGIYLMRVEDSGVVSIATFDPATGLTSEQAEAAAAKKTRIRTAAEKLFGNGPTRP